MEVGRNVDRIWFQPLSTYLADQRQCQALGPICLPVPLGKLRTSLQITASNDSKLVSAQSPVAKTVQVHQSTMKNDVMSMTPVEFVALPAGKTVTLDPHNYHIMLIDLVQQIKEGDKVPLTLTVENTKGEKESIKVEATARALNMPDHSKMN